MQLIFYLARVTSACQSAFKTEDKIFKEANM